MIKHPTSTYLPGLAIFMLLFVGCESGGITNRINEKTATFATLSIEEKKYIEDGLILPGFTRDMAYMAVGKPNSIETKDKNGQPHEIWIYRRFYPSSRLEIILTDYARARNPDLINSGHTETETSGARDSIPTSDGSIRPTRNVKMASLNLPDVPVYNLYIIFLEGKIVDLRMESLDGTPL